eukprot:3724251-Amphidinium_carterae.1
MFFGRYKRAPEPEERQLFGEIMDSDRQLPDSWPPPANWRTALPRHVGARALVPVGPDTMAEPPAKCRKKRASPSKRKTRKKTKKTELQTGANRTLFPWPNPPRIGRGGHRSDRLACPDRTWIDEYEPELGERAAACVSGTLERKIWFSFPLFKTGSARQLRVGRAV